MHKFEKAGLGKAPFRYTGCERVVYQAVPGDPNCPVQPGGSCDYCGTGISLFHYIRSADGRTFKVGSECVAKTGDAGLIKASKKANSKARKEMEAARIESAAVLFEDNRLVFEALPHPQDWMAEKGKTLADSIDWMVVHAGHSGKLRTARLIERIVKAAN